MRAICKTRAERGGVELVEDLPVPEPGPGEVRLRVGAAGLCGTDVHIYHWVPWAAARVSLPRILGHEMGGTVDRVGAGVTHVAVGDLVSVESHLWCGRCYPCRNGNPHVCASTHYPGIDMPGGFAEWVVLPERLVWVHRVPVSLEVAALFEPFGIAVHAAMEGSGIAGRDVLVSGCGPIGLMCVGVARALGAARVIATDVNPLRLRAAESFGASRLVNPAEHDPVAAVRDETAGRGADVVLECAGHEDALRAGVQALSPGGELRLVGVPGEPITVDLSAWILKGIVVRAIHGRRLFQSWEHASRLVAAGKIDLRPLVSHRLGLRDGVRSFEIVERGEGVKVLIVPEGGPS